MKRIMAMALCAALLLCALPAPALAQGAMGDIIDYGAIMAQLSAPTTAAYFTVGSFRLLGRINHASALDEAKIDDLAFEVFAEMDTAYNKVREAKGYTKLAEVKAADPSLWDGALKLLMAVSGTDAIETAYREITGQATQAEIDLAIAGYLSGKAAGSVGGGAIVAAGGATLAGSAATAGIIAGICFNFGFYLGSKIGEFINHIKFEMEVRDARKLLDEFDTRLRIKCLNWDERHGTEWRITVNDAAQRTAPILGIANCGQTLRVSGTFYQDEVNEDKSFAGGYHGYISLTVEHELGEFDSAVLPEVFLKSFYGSLFDRVYMFYAQNEVNPLLRVSGSGEVRFDIAASGDAGRVEVRDMVVFDDLTWDYGFAYSLNIFGGNLGGIFDAGGNIDRSVIHMHEHSEFGIGAHMPNRSTVTLNFTKMQFEAGYSGPATSFYEVMGGSRCEPIVSDTALLGFLRGGMKMTFYPATHFSGVIS